ncbi:MAG: MraY family glycosyltransferase [Chitinophagales bacterium]
MEQQFYWFVLFVAIFLFGYTTHALFLRFSRGLGVRQPSALGQERWSAEVKPSVGGLTFFICFSVSISLLPIEGINMLSELKRTSFTAACCLGFLLGLADDTYDTVPIVKFLGQVLCGMILCLGGIVIQFSGNVFVDYALTTFWVIAIMNSINMLDNMDAITTSVSISIVLTAIGMALLIVSPSLWVYPCIIGVLASLVAFLPYNWNPAKIYMGDTGSQFLGVFLAGLGVELFWNHRVDYGGIVQVQQFMIPILVFAVPIMDTITVFVRRLLRRTSPFVGGRDHLAHHLVYCGFSEQQVAIILFFLSIVFGVLSLSFFFEQYPFNLSLIGWSLVLLNIFLIVFFVLQLYYNRGAEKKGQP